MNRQIKFRAWDELNQEMVYEKTGIFSGGKSSWEILRLYENVMQFTGLHDINGKEIYEGDILKQTRLNGSIHYYKIFNVNGGFAFNTHQDDFYKPQSEIYFYESTADMQNSGFISNLEIIGNIFENPDLVKL